MQKFRFLEEKQGNAFVTSQMEEYAIGAYSKKQSRPKGRLFYLAERASV